MASISDTLVTLNRSIGWTCSPESLTGVLGRLCERGLNHCTHCAPQAVKSCYSHPSRREPTLTELQMPALAISSSSIILSDTGPEMTSGPLTSFVCEQAEMDAAPAIKTGAIKKRLSFICIPHNP